MYSNFNLPFFGNIILKKIDNQFFEKRIKVGGKELWLSMGYVESELSEEKINAISFVLDNLLKFINYSQSLLERDFREEEDGEVLDCIKWHVEEDVIKMKEDKFFDSSGKEKNISNLFNLDLIQIQPSNKYAFFLFEYSIDKEISNRVCQVCFNENLKFDSFSTAS